VGDGFEFLKDPAPVPKRCAFCRQELGADLPTRCARCSAVYHSDCWAANGKRCAVYGCEPAPKPVAAAPAREPFRFPVESSSGYWVFIVVGILVTRGLTSTTPDRNRTSIESPPPRAERSSPNDVRAEPRDSLFFERGCFHYDHQDWNECIGDFELAGAKLPSLRDAAEIRMFFARSRLGRGVTAKRQLLDYLQNRRWKVNAYEERSLLFVAGEIPEKEYLDRISQPERECEAYFYAGTLRLIAGDVSVARDYFTRSVATNVSQYSEFMSARAELKALDSGR
jgi:hypothetical protein